MPREMIESHIMMWIAVLIALVLSLARAGLCGLAAAQAWPRPGHGGG